MYIHTVSPSETIYQISRKYGIHPTKIIEANTIEDPDRLSVGQKLLILTPTKTHTVRGGDTLKRIAARFGVSLRSLLRNNPSLCGNDKIYPEEILTIKYDPPLHGIAVLNGYCYSGCSMQRLQTMLPYVNYVSISALINENDRLKSVMNGTPMLEEVRNAGRIPLLRVYDRRSFEEIAKNVKEYAKGLAALTKKSGYDGITLGAYEICDDERYEEILFEFKKALINENLIFFLETNANRPYKTTDIPDATIFSYTKCSEENIKSFSESEEKVYNEFAERQDASKALIDLSPFAYTGKAGIPISNAISEAVRNGREIKYDKEKMICTIDSTSYNAEKKKTQKTVFESPENIKAKLDLCSELGFMGMSVDIMRTPIEYMMMINSNFCCGVDYI